MKRRMKKGLLVIVAVFAVTGSYMSTIGAPDGEGGGGSPLLDPPAVKEIPIPPIPEVDEDTFSPGVRPKQVKRVPMIAEGKRLVNREGRLVRRTTGDGAQKTEEVVFVLDSGDKPIRLSPNKLRESMENMSDYGDKPIRFRISGLVSVYRGKNYILLSKTIMIPKTETKL
ncbi:MAG: hypothetical protein QGD94_03980 [Planctomycetia bacterium]|nr:hypothetical protein [Planctomycetia bacterium]